MGSRTRIAAAACLVASGLLVGGPAAATAFADPGASPADTETAEQRDDDADTAPDVEAGAVDPEVEPEVEAAAVDADTEPDVEPEVDPDAEVGVEPDVDADAAGEGSAGDDAARRLPCCADGDEDCEHGGWPWPWPGPDPEEPVEDSSGSDGSYGGGRPAAPPVLRPMPGGAAPPELMPPIEEPPQPDVVDVVPGMGLPAAGAPAAPISVPLIVSAPAGPGPAAGGGGTVAGLPAAPRQATAGPPAGREPLPATAGSNVTVPASSYRVGYGEYLRTAGVSQIAVLALPGLAGILVLTGAGGLVGYRQAKAGHVVRPSGIARFMN